jgi:hypothetical protein
VKADLELRLKETYGMNGRSALSCARVRRHRLGRPSRAGWRGGSPFKLGTFEQGGRTFLGLVLRDAQIVDIAARNAAYERRTRRRRS